MKKYSLLFGSLLAFSLVFSACGGSDSSTGNTSETKSGVFLDAAVEGLGYKTASQSGKTDIDGTFKYKTVKKFSLV